MGLTSWIKKKYDEHKFQKAQALSAKGNLEEAIKILQQILETHPFAPKHLLSVYHRQVTESSFYSNVIQNIANLYLVHKELKSVCINFNAYIGNAGKLNIAINYASVLYEKGIVELKPFFIKYSVQYIKCNSRLTTLCHLSASHSLLTELSHCLFDDLSKAYSESKDLNECLRFALLIEPYVSDKRFYETYSNIRFDIIATDRITDETVLNLDILLSDIKSKYKLAQSAINGFLYKELLLAEKLYSNQQYVESLQISQRLLDKYPAAKTIYANSAYQLYKNNSSGISKIDCALLCNTLGQSGMDFIKSIERYVPFASYKKIYKNAVCDLLNVYAKTDNLDNGTKLLKYVWALVPDVEYFSACISWTYESYGHKIVAFILSNTNTFLHKGNYVDAFVNEIIKLSDIEFIISSLEKLLPSYKRIESLYVDQIVRFAGGHEVKESIKRLNRGLKITENQSLINAKVQYCNAYINSNCYDANFITKECKSVIGKHAEAEVMLAQLAIDKAVSAKNIEDKESSIKTALNYNTHHNTPFDQSKYNQKLPEINRILLSLAEQYYTMQDENRAISLLYLLRDNKLNWFEMYGHLKLSAIDKITKTKDALDLLYNIVAEGKNTNANVLESLWHKIISITAISTENQSFDTKIEIYNQLLVKLLKECTTINKSTFEKCVKEKLEQSYLLRGKELEKLGHYDKAINDYSQILGGTHNYPDIMSRLYICKLKSPKILSLLDDYQIDKLLQKTNNKLYQKDLAFRWCLYLINCGQMERVESINERILKNDAQISALCNEEKILRQERILSDLNAQLYKLNSGELTAKEADALEKGLPELLQSINQIAKLPLKTARELKETIRCYTIEKYYEQANYIESQKRLKVKESEYLSDPLALRNIAIMCLCAAEAGQLKDSNYKEFLSIWATAIYQQTLFVQSLDYTSWDDPYVFSLYDALGKMEESGDRLPNNINYSEESDDKTVLIRDVQKALIIRMEVALENNPQYQNFFLSQIEAMDKLAEQNLDTCCVLVAPHMLSLSPQYKRSVTNALSIEVNAHYDNWEDILEIGNLYGINTGTFGNYATAIQYLKDAIASIGSKSLARTAFTQTRVDSIKKFPKIFSTLLSTVKTALNSKISEDTGYEHVISEFGQICKQLDDDGFSYNFSNYINQDVVKKLNNKILDLAKGTEVLVSVYDYCKCNPHIKRNLGNIVESLIYKYIKDGNSNDLGALDKLLSSSRDFDNSVANALTGDSDTPEEIILLQFATNEYRFDVLKSRIEGKSSKIQAQFKKTSTKLISIKINLQLSSVIEGVNNETMTKYAALEKMYDIYKDNRDNDRVCANLATLIPMCVMEYVIPNKFGQQKVINVLEELKYNISSTFRKHTSEINQAYNLIWNQLPYNVRQTLQGSNTNTSLTTEGIALKRGLNYLKSLS